MVIRSLFSGGYSEKLVVSLLYLFLGQYFVETSYCLGFMSSWLWSHLI